MNDLTERAIKIAIGNRTLDIETIIGMLSDRRKNMIGRVGYVLNKLLEKRGGKNEIQMGNKTIKGYEKK